MIEEIGQSEAYVRALPQKDDSTTLLWIVNLFSISNLQDAVIDHLLCLDILNSLLVFVQLFVFSLHELFHPVLLICFQNSNNFFSWTREEANIRSVIITWEE